MVVSALTVLPAYGSGTVPPETGTCRKVSFQGDVAQGKAWSTPLGGGWTLSLLPIAPSGAGYTGWDIAVDREGGTGYPDALLLATPPYGSLNEREIGTTFGLRAQDAIGWNPRSFRFLTDVRAFAEGQRVYRGLLQSGALHRADQGTMTANGTDQRAIGRLLDLQQHAAAGELQILDAHIVPGTGDPVSYARNWAIGAGRTPHEVDPAPSAAASPRGQVNWMKFSISVWLPKTWVLPAHVQGVPSPCGNDARSDTP